MFPAVRILLLHNYSTLRGGADRCVFDLKTFLEEKGHEVFLFTAEGNCGLVAPRLKNAFRYLYNFEAAKKLEKFLERARPDIAHCHNIYGHLTPSVLPVLKKAGIPVVMTLHDWKLVCPNHRLFTQGALCERCRGKHFYNAVFHRCFQDSLAKSFLGSTEAYLHHAFRLYEKHVDCFISPSRFLKEKYVSFGWDAGRIQVIPHFVRIPAFSPAPPPEGVVFAGGLTEGKGVRFLWQALEKIRTPITVTWAGEGPLLEECKREASRSPHRIRGPFFQDSTRLHQTIRSALVTVLPSLWYENQPLSILESYSLERGVIGSNHGGIAELIEDQKTGLLFEPGNPESLAQAITALLSNPEKALEMGREGRRKVENDFTPQLHYNRLIQIYEKL